MTWEWMSSDPTRTARLPFTALAVLLILSGAAAEIPSRSPDAVQERSLDVRINADRLVSRIMQLAEIGGTEKGGVDRVAFSDSDLRSRGFLRDLMVGAGLAVSVDPAGNLIGRRSGTEDDLPVILLGSHTDTVPHGGKYDGALGVLAALECLQVLQERNLAARHPIEMIVFTDEEGGLIGSRALAGNLTDEALDIKTLSGKTVREGILALGGDPTRLDAAVRAPGSILAYLELHIEQGGVLESQDIDIGVVAGIVGIRHWTVTVQGLANHAGTTPMDKRRDALVAAARFILSVRRIALNEPGTQVGTVGRIRAEPGAPNVIPGRVIMSLELRDLSGDKISALFKEIERDAAVIASETGTMISFDGIDDAAEPAPTDPELRRLISDAARGLDLTALVMPSGAGHDAQEVARIAPIGMIFIPSINGISHSPQEHSRPRDLVNGADVLLRALLEIDRTR